MKKVSVIKKCILGVAVALITLNEYVIFRYKQFNWAHLECETPKKCFKILLVADPQILGEYKETWLAIWDSDRYLTKTYTRAFNFVRPDLVAFLGDLMDEGSIANIKQYQRYLDRFTDIFTVDEETVQKIYLPGDNDIGGEEEPITEFKVNRFTRYFSGDNVIVYENLTVYEINRITERIPAKHDASNVNVVLSHMPIVYTPSNYVEQTLKQLQPHLIFSGHEHKSFYIHTSQANDDGTRVAFQITENTQAIRVQLKDEDVFEFLVPTCSYRMGERSVGYAYALIDTSKRTLQYTVLWLPDRLLSLWIYLGGLFLIGYLTLMVLLIKCQRYYCHKFIRTKIDV